jgi:type IV pilus assembly protein PilB
MERNSLIETVNGGSESITREEMIKSTIIGGQSMREEFFDLREALEALKVSRATLYRWMKEERLKGKKLGNQWRFPKSEIYKLLEESPIEQDETIIQMYTDAIAVYKSLLKEMEVDEEKIDNLISSQMDETSDIIENASQIRMLANLIIIYGVLQKVSDIHIELYGNNVRIRHRDTGTLFKVTELSGEILPSLIKEIKTISNCNPLVDRAPQDGAFSKNFGEHEVAFRVSFFPCAEEESVVIRLLNKEISIPKLEDLGLNPVDLEILRKAINKKIGLIIFSGPTGSGKTMFMYSCLNEINTEDRNIMTAEDPIEFKFPGINQSEISPARGYTFPIAIKSMMRHDPDVIGIGEIREPGTMGLITQAATTGCLAFSTISAADSFDALRRIVEMKIDPPYPIKEALSVLVSARIVKKICPLCKDKAEIDPQIIRSISGKMQISKIAFKGKGCKYCHQTGYKGTAAICELLEVTDEIKNIMWNGVRSSDFKNVAISQGMNTLENEAIRKVEEGVTTLEEALRVLK